MFILLHIRHVPNPNLKGRKVFNITYGITTLKKYVDPNHALIVKKIKEEINGSIKGNFEKQPTKKRPNVLRSVISKLFVVKDPFKKDDEQ
jgi:hypothetical protein